MASKKRIAALGLSGVALVSLLSGAFAFTHATSATHAAASAGIHGKTLTLTYKGTSSLTTANTVSGSGSYSMDLETRDDPDEASDGSGPHADAPNISKIDTSKLGSAKSTTVTNAPSSTTGFAGLNHYDNRYADHGNQFSLEPPDQALCVGGNFVLESVNTVISAYQKTSSNHNQVAGPVSLNSFFGLQSEIKRTQAGGKTVGTYGQFTSDPKCYYDASTQRWFVTILEIDTDPATGGYEPHSHELIAVSQTSSPVGKYNIYALDTTNDGSNGTPSDTSCPCFGDQPLIGADANGFYVTSNEYPLFQSGFNGAKMYAVSKAKLVAGATNITVAYYDLSQVALPASDQALGGIWYSVQPATTPAGGTFDTSNNGTEYFMSALQYDAYNPDTRVATWALTNTAALNTDPTQVALSHTIVDGGAPYIAAINYINGSPFGYGFAAPQKKGPTPLADYLNTNGNNECGTACGNQGLDALNANDDRMNQVVYADGKLWSGVNTVLAPTATLPYPFGYPVGIAYFVVTPTDTDGTLTATMTKTGLIGAGQDSVLFPSIGVNAQGKGVVAFTLSGPDYYPSAAYATIDATNGAGDVTIAANGAGPDDGFTGYPFAGGNTVARWGDYSASVAAADGTIWSATEYIGQTCTTAQFEQDFTCGKTRSELANWGTYVFQVKP